MPTGFSDVIGSARASGQNLTVVPRPSSGKVQRMNHESASLPPHSSKFVILKVRQVLREYEFKNASRFRTADNSHHLRGRLFLFGSLALPVVWRSGCRTFQPRIYDCIRNISATRLSDPSSLRVSATHFTWPSCKPRRVANCGKSSG